VRASVTNETSELTKDNIKVFLDGEEKSDFSYDQNTDRLTYDIAGRLSKGKHRVRIEATDDAGNEASKVIAFEIRRR
jgi:hypothetical protein